MYTHMHTHYSLPCLRPNFQISQTLKTVPDFKTTVVRKGGAVKFSSLGRMRPPLSFQAINQYRREKHKNGTHHAVIIWFPAWKKVYSLMGLWSLHKLAFLQKIWRSNRRQKKEKGRKIVGRRSNTMAFIAATLAVIRILSLVAN